ncbi:MAG: hypothetical protein AB1640_03935, partial [bacterium]
RSELTENPLIDRKLLGVPSAALTYVGCQAYKQSFLLSDWLLNRGLTASRPRTQHGAAPVP